ncbi:MAG: rhodanese-like domain-containing protein [Planctomycetota bacterium]|jgi:rhodanese-related sulfurtransferase
MKDFAATIMFSTLVWLLALASLASAHSDVTTQEAKDMIDTNENLIVVDVREVNEYCDSAGHIPGALNFPWISQVFHQRHQELAIDAEILLVCRSGNRSHHAGNFLDSQGYLHVYDMLGGMSAWTWETTGCIDSDGDGVNDDLDNCPADPNPNQIDSDADRMGNFCDDDCPNLDGLNPVSFIDFAMFAQNWLLTGPALAGDLDNSQAVDEDDLRIFTDYWLSNCYEE